MQKSEFCEEKYRKLSEIHDLLIENGYTLSEFIDHVKGKQGEKWMELLFSESIALIYLPYLTMSDIKNMDTAICNKEYRDKWLEQLKNIQLISPLYLANFKYDEDEAVRNFNLMIEWLIDKKIKFKDLSLELYLNDVSYALPEMYMYHLTRNNPNMKAFKFTGNSSDLLCLSSNCFILLAHHCQNLEVLKFCGGFLPRDAFSILGATCHRLKSIYIFSGLYEDNTNDLEVLITNNRNLEDIEILYWNNVLGGFFTCLGNSCPALKRLEFRGHTRHERVTLTNEQIKIFTKGCSQLKSFTSNYHLCHNYFLQCFGLYNPLLETLQVPSNKTMITASSLEYLSKGCPRLCDLHLFSFELPTDGLTYLALHGAALENLILRKCKIADEGFTEIGKIRNLTSLIFVDMNNLTDRHIYNIIQNNHKLTYVGINDRTKLTVSTLFSIAANCPNLQQISIRTNISTLEAYWELFHKCPNLRYINSNTDYIPIEIRTALNERSKHNLLRK